MRPALLIFSGAVHMPSHLIPSLTRKRTGGGQMVDAEGRKGQKETLIRTQENIRVPRVRCTIPSSGPTNS